ncbi:MAG TPA: Asd/ArgC dimerization domain-containing protein [Acidobacteriaceae bacterium]|nr:Asd/ArgC dimerization domain-containing protein [Acidobacteriaceae bacterium]
MSDKSLRIALVGAGTLLGKALSDELAVSAFASADLRLLDDDEDVQGKLAAVDDEMTLIQRIEPDSFDGCEFVFFACDPAITKKHLRQALKARACIVDLSGELERTPGVLVRAPWVPERPAGGAPAGGRGPAKSAMPDLDTRAVVSAHPVAVLLAMLAARSQKVGPLHGLWATLLQPASEYGHAALEELHQQTANLLSFQPLPTEVFGGQTAFTLAVSFDAAGQAALASAADRIRRHYAKISSVPASSLALQVIQVPVFHGYALSVSVEFPHPVAAGALAKALAGSHVRIVADATAFPGNVQAVEEQEAQILVQPVFPPSESEAAAEAGTKNPSAKQNEPKETNRFWLWIVADNLKFAAQNAIACAVELNRLRPRGKVQ